MKKLQIVGMLASVEYEAIQGMTVLGNVEQGATAEHYHNIGFKCPVRVQLEGSANIEESSSLIFVPSADAIEHNVNVQFLPMTDEDRANKNVQAVVTVMGYLTLPTGKKLNVIPNKFNLGSVVVA